MARGEGVAVSWRNARSAHVTSGQVQATVRTANAAKTVTAGGRCFGIGGAVL